MGNKPLLAQTCYIRNYTRNPSHALTRKFVGVVSNINNYLAKFPPKYDFVQKLSDDALLDPLSEHFPKSSRTLLTEHGHKMGNGTINRFINLCKRLEVVEIIEVEKIYQHIIEVNNSDSLYDISNHMLRKKDQNKSKMFAKRKSKRKSNFYSDRHGQNNIHDTVYCNVLKAEFNGTYSKNTNHKERSNKNKHSRQRKQRKFHLLQKENVEQRKRYKKKITSLKNKSKNRKTESSNSSEDEIKNGKVQILEPPDDEFNDSEPSLDIISSSRLSNSDNKREKGCR